MSTYRNQKWSGNETIEILKQLSLMQVEPKAWSVNGMVCELVYGVVNKAWSVNEVML